MLFLRTTLVAAALAIGGVLVLTQPACAQRRGGGGGFHASFAGHAGGGFRGARRPSGFRRMAGLSRRGFRPGLRARVARPFGSFPGIGGGLGGGLGWSPGSGLAWPDDSGNDDNTDYESPDEEAAPVTYDYPPPEGLSPPAPPPAAARGFVQVRLPDPQAKVVFNGKKTSASGSVRNFVTPPLRPGQDYPCEVTATWTQGGRRITERRTVTVSAGGTSIVYFTRPTALPTAIATPATP